jgi:hypothetical protein
MKRREFLGFLGQLSLAWAASATAGCLDFDALGKRYQENVGRDGFNPYNPYGPYDLSSPYNPYGPYDLSPYNPYNPYGPYDLSSPYNPYGPYDLSNPYEPHDMQPYGLYGSLTHPQRPRRAGEEEDRVLAALLGTTPQRG